MTRYQQPDYRKLAETLRRAYGVVRSQERGTPQQQAEAVRRAQGMLRGVIGTTSDAQGANTEA